MKAKYLKRFSSIAFAFILAGLTFPGTLRSAEPQTVPHRTQPQRQSQTPRQAQAHRQAQMQTQRQAQTRRQVQARPQAQSQAQAKTHLNRSNPRSRKLAAERIKERPSENPVRFAFAPKKKIQAGPQLETNPPAGAVLSTFLTGEISPELLDWHVNQRKRARYEQLLAARGELPAKPRSRSEYGEMLDRMAFSFGEPAYRDADGYYDPSNGSILVQLLTGHQNGEMRGWKQDQIALAQRQPAQIPFQYAPAFPAPREMMTAGFRPRPAEPLPARGLRSAALTGNTEAREPIRTASAEEPRYIDDGFPTGKPRRAGNGIRQVSAEIRTPAPLPVLQKGEEINRAGQVRAYDEDENGWSPAE